MAQAQVPENDEHEEEAEEETEEGGDDVALEPGANADSKADVEKYIGKEVRALYEVHSYRHAAAILANSYSDLLGELEGALQDFRITRREIAMPGGNESDIPKKLSRYLRPKDWVESRIQGDLQVRLEKHTEEFVEGAKSRKVTLPSEDPVVIENFIDGHKIDYLKGRVAFDLEWNSKDQTFDRDLYAMRTFHECGLISVGVLVTRSVKMNSVFDEVQQLNKAGVPIVHDSGSKKGQPKMVRSKYGASTTWMGKLLYRLNAGRHGGCPILAIGITPGLLAD